MDEKLYKYTGAGLDNIYLANGKGYEIKQTPFGEGITIHNLDGLHKAIACDLVNDNPNWTGAELRFIRKELEFTQGRLGFFVSRDAQTVARWENEKSDVPEDATNMVRGIYTSRVNGGVQFEELIEHINDLDCDIHGLEKQVKAYEEDQSGWHTIKAA